jgi:DNA-binding LytR/AlgR family response regulator
MQKIILPISSGELIIRTDDLSHISAKGERYCWFVMTCGKRKLVRILFSEILIHLPSPPFYQVHKEHIVHFDRVKKIIGGNGMKLELESGVFLPISKKMIDQVLL